MLRKLYGLLEEILPLHRNERKGFLVMVLLCLLMMCYVSYQHHFSKPDAIPEILIAEKSLELEKKQQEAYAAYKPKPNISYFKFNPNTLDSSGWLKLGFSPKQVRSILKYRTKGSFRKKSDISKLFVVSDRKYKELEPFIDLPGKAFSKVRADTKKRYENRDSSFWDTPKPRSIVQLNNANLEELEALPHIGPKTAAQIISFRDLLGGFHSKEQIAMVYYLRDKPEAVKELLNMVSVGEGKVKRINVNEAEAATLADHPYIDWKQAKALVNYRKNHGEYEELEHIKRTKLISDELFLKIAPYLTTE